MRIVNSETIALAVDFQERLLPIIHDAGALTGNAKTLLDGLNVLGIPLLVSEQYPKGLGRTVDVLRDAAGNAAYFEKTAFSCYLDPEIRKAIDASHCKNIIVCGIEMHICVLQTCVDLLSAGFRIVCIEDCVGSRKQQDKATGLRRIVGEGAEISCYESILFELLQDANSPNFKAISNLVK